MLQQKAFRHTSVWKPNGWGACRLATPDEMLLLKGLQPYLPWPRYLQASWALAAAEMPPPLPLQALMHTSAMAHQPYHRATAKEGTVSDKMAVLQKAITDWRPVPRREHSRPQTSPVSQMAPDEMDVWQVCVRYKM